MTIVGLELSYSGGERSDGFWTGIHSLTMDSGKVSEGMELDCWDGKPLCNKYISAGTKKASDNSTKKRLIDSKMFKEHLETEQLARNEHVVKAAISAGISPIVTLKLHGTSQRVGHVLVDRKLSWIERLLKMLNINIQEQEWSYLNGTRRVIVGSTSNGYYSNAFRELAAKPFYGNLFKGETVYYEVVGYEQTGNPIMNVCDNKKVNDKEFVRQYGATTTFNYGCAPNTFDIYVYRITLTSVDGRQVDMSWEGVKNRCKELGVKHVPELGRLNASSPDNLVEYIESAYASGTDPIGQNHIREGVCIRIDSGERPTILKHKNFFFKVLEGIAKDTADAVDLEEAS